MLIQIYGNTIDYRKFGDFARNKGCTRRDFAAPIHPSYVTLPPSRMPPPEYFPV